MLSCFEGSKEESTKSSLDLYPQVLEKKKMEPRMMPSIENKEKTLNIALLEPKAGSSKDAQECKAQLLLRSSVKILIC